MALQKRDLLWLAGLLEGEGAFMPGIPTAPNVPVVKLTMTDLEVVQRVAQLMGGLSIHIIRNKNHPEWSTAYTVHLRGGRAVELMNELFPLMHSRRRGQIERAIACYVPKTRVVPQRRLTPAEALEIYRRVHSGETCAALGREFGIANQTVWDIKHGHSWAGLTGHSQEAKK